MVDILRFRVLGPESKVEGLVFRVLWFRDCGLENNGVWNECIVFRVSG